MTLPATAATIAGPGPADPMVPTPHRVVRRKRETHDTFTLWLQPEDGEAAAGFTPGQFNMLYVFGVGEAPISISGDPGDRRTRVHTTRSVGPVTQALDRLRVGDVVGVRGPFGAGWPVEAAEGRDVVIVAGGIGLAPLRPVILHVLGHRDRYRNVAVLYGSRTPGDLLYGRELSRWAGRLDTEVRVTVDRAAPDWRGNVGVVPTLIPHVRFDPATAVAMVCGPEIMMQFTVQALRARGMKTANIHVSMERNMKCAVGFCGHCQFGPTFVCKDGPVFSFERIERLFGVPEI